MAVVLFFLADVRVRKSFAGKIFFVISGFHRLWGFEWGFSCQAEWKRADGIERLILLGAANASAHTERC
jgi:hypothetical protein